jgi:hypothetical protein
VVLLVRIGHDPRLENENKTQENTQMKNYEQSGCNTSRKGPSNKESVTIQYDLPMSELIGGLGQDIERFSADIGMIVIQQVMEAEIASRLGSHGQQSQLPTRIPTWLCDLFWSQSFGPPAADAQCRRPRMSAQELCGFSE